LRKTRTRNQPHIAGSDHRDLHRPTRRQLVAPQNGTVARLFRPQPDSHFRKGNSVVMLPCCGAALERATRMSQSVLVTGGAGYIGGHACRALAGAGYQPVAFDNLSRGHREAVLWGPLVEADLADRERVVMALKTYEPVAVMHFAAYAYVGESVTDPATYY